MRERRKRKNIKRKRLLLLYPTEKLAREESQRRLQMFGVPIDIGGCRKGGVTMPHLEESMEHFGITEKEIREVPHIYHASNCDFYREKMGIDWMLKDIKHTRKQEKRKVRIIIDYDADFPAIVAQVMFQ